MEIVTIKLKDFYRNATDTERIIIDYILQKPKKTSTLTIHELAEVTYSSSSTIIRLCKKCGYEGYRDFSKQLTYEIAVREDYREKRQLEINKDDDIDDVINKISQNNILALEELSQTINADTIIRSIDIIDQADRIFIFGMGASFLVAKDLHMKLARVNKMAHINEDWHTMLLMSKNVSKNDVVIIISYSGKTTEMITCLQVAKENGATIIAITKEEATEISTKADLNMYVPAKEFSFRSGAMSSRIAQLNIVDILYTSYISKTFDNFISLIERSYIEK
ncbi:MurR/RpiR family transcriptional regulator [Dolosigranulum pigrum]|uniref:MurR/RpiR family transcriptional regulator n=1 Tax=Dolosigranulum pigrum TaxID=29394 RepID=UPI00242E2202|nr:MurR/RpiR family transcriptional regulator [Dolosigranulum pigrum]